MSVEGVKEGEVTTLQEGCKLMSCFDDLRGEIWEVWEGWLYHWWSQLGLPVVVARLNQDGRRFLPFGVGAAIEMEGASKRRKEVTVGLVWINLVRRSRMLVRILEVAWIDRVVWVCGIVDGLWPLPL